MKEIIAKLNKNFENRVRLGIMSTLMVNEEMDFIALKELLGVTDGNLASHLKALEKHDLISVKKQFVGRKPKTTYLITQNGRVAFVEHLNALEQLLKKD
ncbi:transcriptional regulator [Marinilabiliaceae bacterium JC017]|nr:transcriptional regulator [Marinilabiliaceae bacterium JC017]